MCDENVSEVIVKKCLSDGKVVMAAAVLVCMCFKKVVGGLDSIPVLRWQVGLLVAWFSDSLRTRTRNKIYMP